MAKYNKIRYIDVSNGLGIRVSIFFQGCNFQCKGCFNPETWDFNEGKDFTKDTKELVLKLCNKSQIKGLSILGGEPLHKKNIVEVLDLCKSFKEQFPEKDIWVWTGFSMKELLLDSGYKGNLLKYIDYLVDGRFSIEKKDPNLLFRGSRNQTIYEKKDGVWDISKLNDK